MNFLKLIPIILFLLFNTNLFGQNECVIIHLGQLKYPNGKNDIYGLQEIVKNQLINLGFNVMEDENQNNINLELKKKCKIIKCGITHSTNYYELKKDTVNIFFIENKNEIYRVTGITNVFELTFKTGYRKATISASNQIDKNKIIFSNIK